MRNIDVDAIFGVAQPSASRKLLDVAAPEVGRLERLESGGRQQDINVDGHAPVTELVESHRPDDGVRNLLRLQSAYEPLQGSLDV